MRVRGERKLRRVGELRRSGQLADGFLADAQTVRDRPVAHALAFQRFDTVQTLPGHSSSTAPPTRLSSKGGHPARRMSTQQALALPLPAPPNSVVINARCSLRIEADQRAIVVAGLPVHHYCAQDAVAEAYAMVLLVDSGFAQQTDVARAFDRSVRTVRRYQRR